jgi:hypothetical protein
MLLNVKAGKKVLPDQYTYLFVPGFMWKRYPGERRHALSLSAAKHFHFWLHANRCLCSSRIAGGLIVGYFWESLVHFKRKGLDASLAKVASALDAFAIPTPIADTNNQS